MKTITLIPNRCRDYTSSITAEAALREGRDFIVADVSSPWDGKPVNLEGLERAGIAAARLRFNKLRQVTTIVLAKPEYPSTADRRA